MILLLGFALAFASAQSVQPPVRDKFSIEYFNAADFQGEIANTAFADKIDFNITDLPIGNWSARYTGDIYFSDDNITFKAEHVNGSAALYIDGMTKPIEMIANQVDGGFILNMKHMKGLQKIRFEYTTHHGPGRAKLSWLKKDL